MTKYWYLLAVLALGISFSACEQDDDDHDHDNEEELITTVTLNFVGTSATGTTATTVSWKDTDGIGGNAPIVDDIVLLANTSYTLSVTLLDESDPADVEDITAEVLAEAAEHLFCFTATGAMSTPAATDSDADGRPLGLTSAFNTGAAGTGTLQVVLRHEPNKAGTDPCSTGETDVEVNFNVSIN